MNELNVRREFKVAVCALSLIHAACGSERRDVEPPMLAAQFSPSPIVESADSLAERGISNATVQQSEDRRRLSITLDNTDGTERVALDFRFGAWSERTEGDEAWYVNDGFELSITDGTNALDVEVTATGDSTFYFNGTLLEDGATAPSTARDLQQYFGLVNDDANLALLVRGNRLEPKTSSVVRQAVNGWQYHIYTKHDGTNSYLHHLYDWPYWADPQGAQTSGGWDCFWLPVGSCPGTETKRIYHSYYNGCNPGDQFYYSNGSTPHGSTHCTSGVFSHGVL